MRQSNRHYLYVWLLALGMLWTMLASLPATADNSDRFAGTVLFMRHALAPGTGDPSGFLVDDCRTQRNLDETGRRQARAIGARLAAANLTLSGIYSSYWCRCLETAQILGLGAVTPFDGLNSFFQGYAPRGATLSRLRAKLDSLPQTAPAVLMVTHYVTIEAITGLPVRSGEIVVYDLKTGTARKLALVSL